MKHFLFFIYAVLFFSVNTFSQNYFQIYIGNDTMGVSCTSNFILTENNNLIFAGSRFIPSQDTGRMLLVRLSETGNITLQKDTISGDSAISPKYIVKTDHNSFWLYALQMHFSHNEPDDVKFLFSEYDYNFNNLRNFKMKLPDSMIITNFSSNARLRYFNHQLIWFDKCHTEKKRGYDFIYRFTDTGDSIDFHLYTGENIFDLKVYDENTVYTTEAGYNDLYMTINKLNSSDLSTDTLFDTNNLPDLYNIVLLYERTFLEFLTDTTFVFSALDFNEQTYIGIFDTSLNLLYHTAFELGSSHQEYPAVKDGITVSEDKNIFITEWSIMQGFTLVKTDDKLNILWEQFFDIGNGFRLQSITAADDGGCYILGEVNINNTWRTLIIKTNENGTLSVQNNKQINFKTRNLLLYPNPGTDILHIRTAVQSTGGTITLYDINGKQIIQKNISQTNTDINTENIPSGIYLYRYRLNNKLIETGKWIKN